jgi:hypothetical protein
VYACEFVWACVHVHACTCLLPRAVAEAPEGMRSDVSVCVCICVGLCACTYLHACVCTCLLPGHVCMFIYMYMLVSVRACCLGTCACTYTCTCLCVYMPLLPRVATEAPEKKEKLVYV